MRKQHYAMQHEEREKTPPDLNEENEIPSHPGRARELERELNLGVKKDPSPAPGMPAAQGGGLRSEIGTTPDIVDPDH